MPLGQTLQSAASTPTSAQIFYAANITGSGLGNDTITVTFTGPATGIISQAGVVAVEYSGLDTMSPLDSVNEAISNNISPSTVLDSGTANPANSNLEVFGAGYADTASVAMTAGSGFTILQASNGSWGTGLVEDNSSAISGNNVLQRATACIGSGAPCPLTPTGNWLMQMAVFRGATWTTAQGTSSTRAHGTVYADQFPGVDIGDQINHAIASLPTGGEVDISPGIFTFATQILPTQSVTIKGAGASYNNLTTHCATTLTWTGGATAPFLITGTAATGTTLRDICLNNTTAAPNNPPVFIDIDNGVGNTYLDHIVIDYPTVNASVAGIRWGATGPVNDSHANNVFVRNTAPVELQFLNIRGQFKGYNVRAVGDGYNGPIHPTNEWQLGNLTQEVHSFNCFACDSNADVPGEVGILINYAENVNFFGLYSEQNAGYAVQIPSSLNGGINANAINFYGPRFISSISNSSEAIDVELSTAKVHVSGGEMLGMWTPSGVPGALVNDIACNAITLDNIDIDAAGGLTLFSNFPAPSGCMLYSSGNVVFGVALAAGSTKAPGGGSLYSYLLNTGSGQAAMTTAPISSGTCGVAISVAASGVLTTDTVTASYASGAISTDGQLTLNAFPTAGSINLQYCNPTAGTVTPTAINVNWTVTR
jgi:hypothetical protein